MKTASRTLVKSAPEVWEQLDQPERMEGLMSALVGHAAQVEVYERVEESKLAWRAGDEARIEVKLAEKGWGTNVSVSAENGQEPTKLEGWLDAVLDEIATPQKRPFEGMTGTPSGTVVEAMVAKSATDEHPIAPEAPVEEPVVQPEEPAAEQADEPEVSEPQPEQPRVEDEPRAEEQTPAAPEPERPFAKLRRFFGIR
jgi:hypothetical protein